VSDGLPAFTPVALAPTLAPPAGFAVFYIPNDFHEDTAKMWNVGVQRELGWNTVLDVSYVGTRGTHIFRNFNVNVPAPGPGASNRAGATWYDALQLKLDRRFSQGLQALVAYTYSRTQDNIATLGLHPSLAIRQRAPGASGSKVLDIPHVFTASVTYELPFGRGASGAGPDAGG
jgi:hypothetical protein